ncbi:uncharacterized protein LOC132754407 [Ruditapes philippinarum]|uniref:uncharacterized protein LOC132754407 n=1 Tax=Ruditapes philippinarum TaxID=129788 RepID=UPI00295A8BEA|nr:uncharacterized protein LOC132754407 [Ruditapes philippinarum]
METETSETLCRGVGEININSEGKSDVKEKAKTNGNVDSKVHGDEGYQEHDNRITREDVTLPDCFKGKLAFVLRNVLTEKECKDYIKKTEKMGYTDALVNIGGGRQQMMKDVRNNTRCIWDSFEEADKIWQRIKQFIPDKWRNREVMGLNERLRFLKYNPGEYFAPHMDGMYMRENGERSFVTIQLYLNQGFKGGSTTFMSFAETERMEVVPETGMVLVFQHDIMHEGSALLEGRKYSMRTDVMYSANISK